MAIMITVFLASIATIGVSSAFPPGYSLEQSFTGFAALSNDQSVSPTTSVRMGTAADPNNDRAAIVFNGGPTVSTINQLSYWTYTVGAGDFGQLTAWIAIYLHTQPGKTYADWMSDYLGGSPDVFYIQAEPIYPYSDYYLVPDISDTLNTWVKWDAFDSTVPLTWVGLESSGSPHGAPTLSDYIVGAITNYSSREYGSLYIAAIKIRMGYGGPWANTLAYVDDVTIEDYFENFEPPPPVPANKDACKKGGWQALTRADFTPFKNQGDCIQYVNTGK
jgi:hypothetical protein